jgi:tetratricopeptide (TPR) repeat protein
MSINRNLVLGFFVFSGLAAVLFYLPKSVVSNNKKLEEKVKEEKEVEKIGETVHSEDPEVVALIEKLKSSSNAEKAESKKSTLYKSLAEAFQKNNQFDSAGFYFEQAGRISRNPDQFCYEAGSAYFDGIAFVTNPSKVEFLSEKARLQFSKVKKGAPNYVDAQTKSALTFVNSPSPMKGILLLRELADKNPENENLVYQLGILSFQSTQYGKAIDRFTKVLELNPNNVNALFYLAQSLQQTGKNKEALVAVEKGLALSKEEDTKASFEEMKKKLKEN